MIRPPRLHPGDTVALVAPAGPLQREEFAEGLARIGKRYRLKVDEGLFAREGYLAGDDARRIDEFLRAMRDPEIKAVFCARGGYGAMRLLPDLDAAFGAGRKPVVGFSDITVVHAVAFKAGGTSLHAPTVNHLGKLPTMMAEELFALLESPAPPGPWTGLQKLSTGCATGLAIGGNLELVSRLLGTPWSWPFEDNVLFLEDIGERPYRIDRSLTQLELAGANQVAAVVVGELTRCLEPDGSGPRAEEVVAERLRRWNVPVLVGAPFGHGQINRPFPLGGRVAVDAGGGTVTFLDGAVAE